MKRKYAHMTNSQIKHMGKMRKIKQSDLVTRLKSLKLVAFDFDGVFTDNFVYVNEYGHESVKCSRADGIGLAMLREIGVHPVIISTEKNSVVARRAEKLEVDCYHGINCKGEFIEQYAENKKIKLSQMAFVGNDINDIPALIISGISVAVADAVPEVKNSADILLRAKGGHGAVRELCEIIAKAFNDV